MNDYIIITAARNEEVFIERTIKSVISQTLLPKLWIIVSDGSTDNTDEIVNKYLGVYNFITLIKISAGSNRNYASQVNAFNIGFKKSIGVEYDFIGNLDADVSFEPDYYEKIISKFYSNIKLGIAGGSVYDKQGNNFKAQFLNNTGNVCGPIQLFRRECFKEIGGYEAIENGPLDIVADIKARMHGWEVKTFNDLKILHYRRTGTARISVLSYRFKQGIIEYSLGNHPIFEIAKCLLRIKESPYLIGSILRAGGYVWSYLRKYNIVLPNDTVKYLRREQIQRLKRKIL